MSSVTRSGGSGGGTGAARILVTNQPPRAAAAGVPLDVALVIEMLSSGEESAASNRRKFTRARHVAPAALEPVGLAPPAPPAPPAPCRTVYTRDANQWGVGFITQDRITVGEEVTLHIADPAGTPLALRCGILRCREVLPGWFEGAVLFSCEEPRLSPESIAAAAAAGQ